MIKHATHLGRDGRPCPYAGLKSRTGSCPLDGYMPATGDVVRLEGSRREWRVVGVWPDGRTVDIDPVIGRSTVAEHLTLIRRTK